MSLFSDGELKDIAIFDSIRKRLDFQCTTCQNIYWKNGQVPIAQRILKVCLISVPEILFYFVTGICLMGIAASILFLYFNLHFRRMKSVKLSSPKLNNVCVFGCMFVYFSVILLGINIKIQLTNIYFRQLCMVRCVLRRTRKYKFPLNVNLFTFRLGRTLCPLDFP